MREGLPTGGRGHTLQGARVALPQARARSRPAPRCSPGAGRVLPEPLALVASRWTLSRRVLILGQAGGGDGACGPPEGALGAVAAVPGVLPSLFVPPSPPRPRPRRRAPLLLPGSLPRPTSCPASERLSSPPPPSPNFTVILAGAGRGGPG